MKTPSENSLPLSVAIRRMQEEYEHREMNELLSDGALQEKLEASGGAALDPGLKTLIVEQMRMARGAISGTMRKPDPDKILHDVSERNAYTHAGLFLEKLQGASRLWDFEEIMSRAVTVTLGEDIEGVPVIGVETHDDQIELKGPVARAFRRYMEYLGVFIALAARTTCRTCVGIPPEVGHCATCDGLGWVAGHAVTMIVEHPAPGVPEDIWSALQKARSWSLLKGATAQDWEDIETLVTRLGDV